MSELKWNWVYYPYLDAPNKQEESALKAGYIKVVCKDEADAVIKELKAQKAQAEDDCAYWKMSEGNAVNAMHETEEYAMQLYNELRHHKYKRCLAMAERCKYRMYYLAAVVEQEASKIIPLKAQIQWYQKRENRMDYWKNRWLEIAEKFKPNNSTAQQGKG